MDSPCCTNWILKHTALDRVNYYPKRVIDPVLTRFYLDDNLYLFSKNINLGLDEMPMEQVLGVLWQPEKYTLKIRSVEKKLSATKREVLSFMSIIFDPLGFVTQQFLNKINYAGIVEEK